MVMNKYYELGNVNTSDFVLKGNTPNTEELTEDWINTNRVTWKKYL